MKITASIKLDRNTKTAAQKLAKELGLSLSTVINSQLKQFVRDKEIVLSQAPKMSTFLEEIISDIEKDVAKKKNFSKPIKTKKDLDSYFDAL